LEILAHVEIERPPAQFPKHRHTFRGQIANTWQDWVVLLFVRACREEVALMHDFQMSYDATLATKLSV
jgi:hypothetical protein